MAIGESGQHGQTAVIENRQKDKGSVIILILKIMVKSVQEEGRKRELVFRMGAGLIGQHGVIVIMETVSDQGKDSV